MMGWQCGHEFWWKWVIRYVWWGWWGTSRRSHEYKRIVTCGSDEMSEWRSGEHISNYIMVAFHMANSEVIPSKPILESQKEWIGRNLITEIEYLWEGWVVHFNNKVSCPEVKIQLLDSIFDSKNLFIGSVIMLLGIFEFATSMTTVSPLIVSVFDENST